MKAENKFIAMMEKHGVPQVVIPNQCWCHTYPRIDPDAESQALQTAPEKVYYYRKRHGSTDFLLVSSYSRGSSATFHEIAPERRAQIVEYSRSDFSGAPGRRWAFEEDVVPVSKEQIEQAIAENRIMNVSHWRCMGDGYVQFKMASLSDLANELSTHNLYFANGPGLTEAEFPDGGVGNSWDSADEFLDEILLYVYSLAKGK